MANADLDISDRRGGIGRERMTRARGAVEAVVDKKSVWVPILIIAIVLPNFFFLGPLRLSIYKFYLLVMFVPMTFMWLAGKFDGIKAPDLLVLGYCMWSVLAVMANHGFAQWEGAGIHFIETFGVFLLARAFIRGPSAHENFFKWYCIAVLVLIPIALFENLTSRRLLAELMSNFAEVYKDAKTYPRLGLFRAQGPFEHPILFGVFCAGALAPAYYVWARGKPQAMRVLAASMMAFGTLTTLSTGAFISFILQGILIFWGFMARNVKNRWRLLASMFAAVYILIDLLSNRSPIGVFISYLTFNSGSSFNRVLIWRYGTDEVARNPLFGIGYGDWIRPAWMGASVDNYWLLTTMKYGLPAAGCLLAAFIMIVVVVGRRDFSMTERINSIRYGYLIAIVGISLSLCTVTLWNAAYVFLIFAVGSGVWMMDYKVEPADGDDAEAEDDTTGRRSAGRARRARKPSGRTPERSARGGTTSRPGREIPTRRGGGHQRPRRS